MVVVRSIFQECLPRVFPKHPFVSQSEVSQNRRCFGVFQEECFQRVANKNVKQCVPQSVFKACPAREPQKNVFNHLNQCLTRVFGKLREWN